IVNSVKKTSRIMTVSEGPASFGIGSEISQIVLEDAFLYLDAPPTRVAGFDTIVPLPRGEYHYMQNPLKILFEAEQIVNY
ncbi:MAG: transketolase C-terminal domain-containing protein, partial [Tannerellaceae bacterium]